MWDLRNFCIRKKCISSPLVSLGRISLFLLLRQIPLKCWRGSGYTTYTKIWHPGLLNILNWGNSRNEAGHKNFMCRCSPTVQKEHSNLWRWRDKERNLYKWALISFPQFITRTHLRPITSYYNCLLFITLSIKILKCNNFFGNSFLLEGFYVT